MTMNGVHADDRKHPLERFALLRGLAPPLLEFVAANSVECRFGEGETLFFKNDPGDFLALVADGWIYEILYGPDGQELIVGAIAPGEAVDEAVLLDRHRRSFTAIAYADTVVLKLARRHFPALLSDPAVLERAYAALCGNLRQAIDNLENMCLHRLEARLARYLLTQLQVRGTPRGNSAEIALPPTQSILAAMVNVSRSKLNEQLQRWHRSGLVSRHRNVLCINDLDTFRDRARLQPGDTVRQTAGGAGAQWRPAA
ncbi:Crp/Fnr family transcriptional regulator [Luteimonas suaedae]|uniref:Crp/Fnr family transcriptional regulator n=1 Tax=Luteimonas suaedae TaxID=2605430 RepID=UPI001CAA35C2|nr:Crp/Fnr family transcriptional regulator [Luteimonas suaedae]